MKETLHLQLGHGPLCRPTAAVTLAPSLPPPLAGPQGKASSRSPPQDRNESGTPHTRPLPLGLLNHMERLQRQAKSIPKTRSFWDPERGLLSPPDGSEMQGLHGFVPKIPKTATKPEPCFVQDYLMELLARGTAWLLMMGSQHEGLGDHLLRPESSPTILRARGQCCALKNLRTSNKKALPSPAL